MITIGITGEMGSGKSTVARLLSEIESDSVVVPFAKPLKDFALNLGWNGKKDIKGRRLLQLLGTECGRECIDDDLWIKKWLRQVDNFSPNTHLIICDDLRFENEANVVRSRCGYIIHVVGRRKGKVLGRFDSFKSLFRHKHKSEKLIPSHYIDFVIDTSSDLLNTKVRLQSLFDRIKQDGTI